jgi:type IV secretory pathway VirB10-like protein
MSEPPREESAVAALSKGSPAHGGGETASDAGSGAGTTKQSVEEGTPPETASVTSAPLPPQLRSTTAAPLPAGPASLSVATETGDDKSSSDESNEEQDDEIVELSKPMRMKSIDELTKSSSARAAGAGEQRKAPEARNRRMSITSQDMAAQAEAMAKLAAMAGESAVEVKPVNKGLVSVVSHLKFAQAGMRGFLRAQCTDLAALRHAGRCCGWSL